MIFKNLLRLFNTKIFQTIATVSLLSFLIFFLNILVALTVNIYSFSNELKGKLGIYLYIKEGDTKEQISKASNATIKLKTELEKAGLNVKYYSKEEGIKTLSKRVPKIIKNFEKYGIENPIPPTLYIIFKSEQQYNNMKDIVMSKQYQDFLLNLDDLGNQNSFKEQEERISRIIEFSNFLIKFYMFLSIVLFIIILWFLVLIIKLNFYSFYNQIEVEKLIGFTYFQIKLPFLFYTFFTIFFAFIFSIFYISTLVQYLDFYFITVFDFDLSNFVLDNIGIIRKGILIEFGFIIFISLLVSNTFLTKLIKKI